MRPLPSAASLAKLPSTITSGQAHRIFGLDRVYVSQLCREGKLAGARPLGGNGVRIHAWQIPVDSVIAYFYHRDRRKSATVSSK